MPKELTLEESYTEEIAKLVDAFSEKDTIGKQSLTQLQTADPRAFAFAAVRFLAQTGTSPGSRFVVHLLSKEKMLPSSLLDERITTGVASTALRTIAGLGTNLQPPLELALNRALQDQPSQEGALRILRLLELLAMIAPPGLWNSFQLELMAYPDKAVRSKAAMLIGRSTKNAAWIGRRFLDRDPRVQASAVEALWTLDAAESKPLLMTAAQSRHNRVAANAALGLYRISETKSVRMLLDMARHKDPLFQVSALWAIGETGDSRFLPFLAEQFKSTQGKTRLAVTRALAQIRRREKERAEAGELRIRVSHARVTADGQRSVGFALTSQPTSNLSSLKKLDFAIWEGSTLIEDYDVKPAGNPALLLAGFVAPRATSATDSYAAAIAAALGRCLPSKRSDDMWRVDRYHIEAPTPASTEGGEPSSMPYSEEIMTAELKARFGFSADAGFLAKLGAPEWHLESAAPDAFAAVHRQCEAFSKVSGKRHLFVFLHEDAEDSFLEESRMKSLQDSIAKIPVVPHGFAPGAAHISKTFRALCQAVPEGTFAETTMEQLPDAVEGVYSLLMNGFEVSYKRAADAEPGPVLLKVASAQGSGQTEIALVAQSP